MNKKTISLVIFLFIIGCSKNKEPVTIHFSNEEVAELNKTGKITKTGEDGIENTYLFDDKYKKYQNKLNKDKMKIANKITRL